MTTLEAMAPNGEVGGSSQENIGVGGVLGVEDDVVSFLPSLPAATSRRQLSGQRGRGALISQMESTNMSH
jgi:hypothetical protein